MAEYRHIRVDVSESVATLTIDRPAVRNALNLETVEECRAALEALTADANAGALIITGAGDSAFVPGADINDIRARGRADGLAAINSSLFAQIERFPRPTIAAINGYALGGGCELALACDIRVAADTATFGQPELGLGIIPGAGGTQRSRVGSRHCSEHFPFRVTSKQMGHSSPRRRTALARPGGGSADRRLVGGRSGPQAGRSWPGGDLAA